MATTDPIIIESYSDNVTRLSDAFDAKDLSGVKDILGDGSNLYNLIDYLLQERPHLHERWRDVDIDPTQFISQALEDFRNNNVDSDSVLGNRLETMLNEINSAADLTQNTSTEISFTGANGSSFALLGNNFGTGANLNTLLDAIAGGASPTDAFFTTLGGQVTSLKLNDSASGTSFGIELNNTETTQNDAETIAFDLGGLKLAFDGSFPRDIATIYTWAKSGAGVQSFLQQESVLVDAFRIEFPNNKLFEVSKDGITLTIPYSSTTDPANTGEEYALQFKLAGDFDEVMKQLPWSTDLTNLQLDGMSLSEFSFSDVILYDDNSANDGAVKTVQDQIALKMTDTQWSFNIDELMLIFEGSPGNTFLDFKEMGDKELSQIFSEARITTEALEAKNEELVKAEFVTGPVTVGGIAIAPGEEVTDFSQLSSGVEHIEGTSSHFVGTDHNDILLNYQLDTIIYGGDGDDHIGAINPWHWYVEGQEPLAQYIGGAGADTFYIPVSPYMPSVEIVDFNPDEGDKIQLIPYEVSNQLTDFFVHAGKVHLDFQRGMGDYIEVTQPGGGISASKQTDGFVGTQYFNVSAGNSPSDGVLVYEQIDGVGMSIVSFSNDFAQLGDAVNDYVANHTLGTGNWFVASNSQIESLSDPTSDYFIGTDNGLWTWDLVTRYPSTNWEYVTEDLAPITIVSDVSDLDILKELTVTDSLDELGVDPNALGNDYYARSKDPAELVFGTRGDNYFDNYNAGQYGNSPTWFFPNGGSDEISGGSGVEVVFVDADATDLITDGLYTVQQIEVPAKTSITLSPSWSDSSELQFNTTVNYTLASHGQSLNYSIDDYYVDLYFAAADALAAAHESGLPAGQDIRSRASNDEAVLSETNYNSGNYTLEYHIYDSNNNSIGTYKPTWSELTAKAQVIQNAITLVDGSAVVGSSTDGTDNVVISVDDAALLSAGVESSFEIVLIGDDGTESSYWYNPTRVIENIGDDDFYYSLSGSLNRVDNSSDVITLAPSWSDSSELQFNTTVNYTLASHGQSLNYSIDDYYVDLYFAAADALAAAHESGLPAGQDIRSRASNDEAVLSETNYNSGNYTLEYHIYDSNNNSIGTYKPTWSELTAKAQVIQNAITLVDGSAVVGSSTDGTDNVVISVDDAALLSAGVESSFEIVLIGDDGTESSYWYNPTRVIENIGDDDFYYSLSGSLNRVDNSSDVITLAPSWSDSSELQFNTTVNYTLASHGQSLNYSIDDYYVDLYFAAADALATAHESGLPAGQDIRSRASNDEAVLSETNYNSGNYTLEYHIYDSNNNSIGTYKPTWSELTAKAQVIQNAITLVDGSAVVGSSTDGTDNVVISVDDAALLSAGVESSFEIVLIGDDGTESSYWYNPTRVIENIGDDDFYYSLSGSSAPTQTLTVEALVPTASATIDGSTRLLHDMAVLSKNGLFVGSLNDSIDNPGTMYFNVTDLTTSITSTHALPAGSDPYGNFHTLGLSNDGDDLFFAASNGFTSTLDGSGYGGVFKYELSTGNLMRVDVKPDGAELTYAGWSLDLNDAFDMTPDGRYVVVAKQDRVDPDIHDDQTRNIYLIDTATGVVNQIDSGYESTGYSGAPHISDDGQKILFESSKVLPDTNGDRVGQTNMYLYDVQSGTHRMLNEYSDGSSFDTVGSAWSADLSGDGRFVSFNSMGLSVDGSGGGHQVYRLDISTGQLEWVSGHDGLGGIYSSISSDGQFVAYQTSGGEVDVLVRDVSAGTTTNLTDAPLIDHGWSSSNPSLADNGSVIFWAWESYVPEDDGSSGDWYYMNFSSDLTVQPDLVYSASGDSLDLTNVEYIHFNDGTYFMGESGTLTEVPSVDLTSYFRLNQYNGDEYQYRLDAYTLPEDFTQNSIYLNFSEADFTSVYGFTVAAGEGLLSIGASAILPNSYQPSANEFKYVGTSNNDIVVFSPDTASNVVQWTPGQDTYYATGERAESFYFDPYTSYSSDTGSMGLTVDNSDGGFTVVTDLGVTHGFGFTKFGDTSLDDVFIGSNASEVFRFRSGGIDEVTGGDGSDQFRLQNNNDSSTPSQLTILDLESVDEISLEDMGFDSTRLDQQITVTSRQFAGEDYTYISVSTDTYSQTDLVGIKGDFALSQMAYQSGGDVELSFVSTVPATEIESSIRVQEVTEDLVDYSRLLVDFRQLPELFIGENDEGIYLNFSSSTQTAPDGSVLQAGTAKLLDQVVQLEDYNAQLDTSLANYYSIRGSDGNDFIATDSSVSAFVSWTPGDDHFVFSDTADWNVFAAWNYRSHISDADYAAKNGLTYDNSGADFQIVSDFGTTTIENVHEFYDSSFNDVFIGSDDVDIWQTVFGGHDTVTGGGGLDQFEVRYYPDRDGFPSKIWEDLGGLHITDYEAGEQIFLKQMGFDVSALTSLDAVYDDIIVSFDGTNTNISVANSEVNLQNIVSVAGEFELASIALSTDGDGDAITVGGTSPDATVVLTLEEANRLITTTDLAGASVGDLIQPSETEFDYLDLRSLSGEWIVDAATGGFGTEGKEVGTAFNRLGDFYDFSGFEGYIVDGNATAGTGRIYFAGAEGDNEIVVVEGGHDLSIDLGLELHDVLSFRGTSDGVLVDFTDTTAEFATSSQTGWTDFSATGMSGAVYGADYLFGSDGADTFTGYADKTNILAGYGGNDTLTGGSLSDVLLGGADQDILVGGAGQDILIDLDKAKLTGGVSDKTGDDAADLFVVRGVESGTADGVTEITDYELGSNTQIYSDRIAFNISVSSLAGTALAAITPDGSLAAADYDKLKSALRVEVTPDTGTPDTDFTVQVFVKASASTALTEDLLVGQTDVSLTGDTKLTAEDRLEYRILDQEDFLSQIQQVVLDQMLYTQDALDVGGGTDYTDDGKNIQTSEAQLLDGTVNLFVALVREDKFAVTSNGEPVLIARRENGQDLTSNFRPGEGNEVILAGTASDEIQIRQIEGANPATVDFGRDTVIERGGDADAIVMPVGIAELFDLDGAGSLVPDLDLTRIQRGREGEGRSLEIKYSDSTPTADSINDVDLVVYKQYVEYDDMFRVEDLKLIDTNNTEATYQLGETTADGLMAEGKSDAVLVGRDGIDDVMLVQWDSSYTEELNFNNQLDIILTDFDAANDVVAFRGYGTDVAADIDGDSTNDGSYSDVVSWKYVDGSGATSSARTNHAEVVVNNGADTTVHLYFADGAPTLDDWLFDPVANG